MGFHFISSGYNVNWLTWQLVTWIQVLFCRCDPDDPPAHITKVILVFEEPDVSSLARRIYGSHIPGDVSKG